MLLKEYSPLGSLGSPPYKNTRGKEVKKSIKLIKNFIINHFKATSSRTIFSPVKSIWILHKNITLNDWLLILYIMSLYLKRTVYKWPWVLEQPHRNQGLQKSQCILSIHPMCICSLPHTYSEPASFGMELGSSPWIAPCTQDGQGVPCCAQPLKHCFVSTCFLSHSLHRTGMPSVSCDKKDSHSEQRHNTDIILEIKNFITPLFLTQGQICQFNTHLLVARNMRSKFSKCSPPQ